MDPLDVFESRLPVNLHERVMASFIAADQHLRETGVTRYYLAPGTAASLRAYAAAMPLRVALKRVRAASQNASGGLSSPSRAAQHASAAIVDFTKHLETRSRRPK